MRLLVVLAFLWATPAAAQAPVELEVRAREAAAVDVEALRVALARELGVEVVLAEGRGDGLRVRVRAIGRRRAVLELRRPDGTRMVRSTELDADPAERLETIVILAVNLVRDESAELLELLRRRRGEPTTEPVTIATEDEAPEPVENAPPEPAVAADPTPPLEPTPPAEEVALAPETPAAVAPPEETAVEPVVSTASAEPEVAAPSPPGQRVLRIGLVTFVGSVPSGEGTEVTLLGGLELSFTPTDFAAIGVRDLGGGAPISGRSGWSAGGTVFGELGWILDPAVVLHAGLGVDLRANGLSDRTTAGVAPMLLVGARFFLVRELSLSLQTAVHAVTTDAWSTNLHVLPQGAVLWTGGLSLALHVS